MAESFVRHGLSPEAARALTLGSIAGQAGYALSHPSESLLDISASIATEGTYTKLGLDQMKRDGFDKPWREAIAAIAAKLGVACCRVSDRCTSRRQCPMPQRPVEAGHQPRFGAGTVVERRLHGAAEMLAHQARETSARARSPSRSQRKRNHFSPKATWRFSSRKMISRMRAVAASPKLGRLLDHGRADIEAARLEYQRHNGDAGEEAFAGGLRRLPEAVMGGQRSVAGAECLRAGRRATRNAWPPRRQPGPNRRRRRAAPARRRSGRSRSQVMSTAESSIWASACRCAIRPFSPPSARLGISRGGSSCNSDGRPGRSGIRAGEERRTSVSRRLMPELVPSPWRARPSPQDQPSARWRGPGRRVCRS